MHYLSDAISCPLFIRVNSDNTRLDFQARLRVTDLTSIKHVHQLQGISKKPRAARATHLVPSGCDRMCPDCRVTDKLFKEYLQSNHYTGGSWFRHGIAPFYTLIAT